MLWVAALLSALLGTVAQSVPSVEITDDSPATSPTAATTAPQTPTDANTSPEQQQTAPTQQQATTQATATTQPNNQNTNNQSPTQQTAQQVTQVTQDPQTQVTVVQQTTVVPGTVQATLTSPTDATAASNPTVSALVSTSGASTIVVVAGMTTTVPASQADAASSSLAALQSDGASHSSGGGSSHKAWVIPVAVVGGLLGAAVMAFVVWRLLRARRRRSSDVDAIKWPEMKASDDDSILMPVGVHRTGGAGVGEEEPEATTPSAATSLMAHSVNGRLSPYHDPAAMYDPYADAYAAPVDYPQSTQSSGHGQPRNPSSNLGHGANLPPGARPHTPLLDPADMREYYAQSPSAERLLSDLPSPTSNTGLLEGNPELDRNGTIRSTASEAPSRFLGVTNPDRPGTADTFKGQQG